MGGLSRGEGRGGQLRWLQDDGEHLKLGAGEQGSRAVRGAEGWAPVGVGRLRGPLWAQVPPKGLGRWTLLPVSFLQDLLPAELVRR